MGVSSVQNFPPRPRRTAVRDRQQHSLIGADVVEHLHDGGEVGGGRRQRIAIAQRRADERRERNDDVRVLQERPHRLHRPDVAANERKLRVIAHGGEAVLPVHEAVDRGHAEAALEERRNENGSEVTGAAGDEDAGHRAVLRDCSPSAVRG
jgi:hypothetical protein